MKTIFKASLLLLTISILFVSCKKDDPDPTARLYLSIQANGSDLVYGKVYNINERAVTFSLAQMYISGITLADDEGTKNEYPSVYAVAKPGMVEIELGILSLSHVHTIDFRVGIDSVTNHSDITKRDAGDALAAQTPTMHWSWNNGYIFLKLEGQVDNDGDGTPETDFLYHIGMDNYAKAVSVAYHTESNPKGDFMDLCVNADLDKYFIGLDFTTDLMTHTMDNMPIATTIVNNTSNVFVKGTCQ